MNIPLSMVWVTSNTPADAGPPVAASTVDRMSNGGTAALAPSPARTSADPRPVRQTPGASAGL